MHRQRVQPWDDTVDCPQRSPYARSKDASGAEGLELPRGGACLRCCASLSPTNQLMVCHFILARCEVTCSNLMQGTLCVQRHILKSCTASLQHANSQSCGSARVPKRHRREPRLQIPQSSMLSPSVYGWMCHWETCAAITAQEDAMPSCISVGWSLSGCVAEA